MFGLLNVNKSPGITSRDLVNQVQRLIGREKIGHAGTLDPLAAGVLVICIGPATRLVEYVQRMQKHYRATFLLGQASQTDDVDGEVRRLDDAPQPDRAQIEAVLPRFIGEIQQQPPAFSAVKVQGRRAYSLARSGQQVDLAARPIHVESMCVLDYQYPRLDLEILCGSGCYVRSLGRDIARALGTEAVMAGLTRAAIGDFRLEDSSDAALLTRDNVSQHLLSPLRALATLPQVELNDAELGRLVQGLPVDNRWAAEGPEIAGLDVQGQLRAILADSGQTQLRPLRNFAA